MTFYAPLACGGRANILTGGPTGLNATMGMGVSRMVGRTRECVEILKGANPDEALNYEGKIFRVKGYRPSWATDEPPFIYQEAAIRTIGERVLPAI